jgi:hypothetical protein
MTRLLSSSINRKGGECIEVLVHFDNSIFFVKEFGNFVSHLSNNLSVNIPIRSFTCDTIPFKVACQNP